MKRLILLLLCASLCQAAPVTIAESAYTDASGRLATGTITISWPSFSNGVSNVAAGSTTVTVTAGVMSVSLVANDTADPPFNYTASFRLQASSYSQQWKVPTVAGPLTINAVTWSSNSPVTVGLDQIRRTGYVAGDIGYYNGTLWTRLPRGTNGQSLTIDTSLSGYLKWATISGSGGGTWGSITGTLSSQTDLASALAAKIGLASLSATSPIVYDNSTGIFTHAASAATIIPCGDTTHSCRLTFDTKGHVSAIANDTIASGGSGTVTVVSSGSLTSTGLVTGGGSATLQTPSSTATLDSSGNLSTPGSLSTGAGGTAAGVIGLTQGTSPSLGTTMVQQYADTAVTSYKFRWPAAAGTGFFLGTNTTNDVVGSFVGFSGTGNVARVTSPTFVTPALGTPSGLVGTNVTGVPLTTGVTGILPVVNGGTGTATPALVQGTNVTITGTWPNQTINSSASGGSGPSIGSGYDGGTSVTTSATDLCSLSIPGNTLGTGGAANSKCMIASFSFTNNTNSAALDFALDYGSQSFTVLSGSATSATIFGAFQLCNNIGVTNAQAITQISGNQSSTNFNPFISTAQEPSQDSTVAKTFKLKATSAGATQTVRVFGCSIK